MIVFNTPKAAEHYIKYKNKQHEKGKDYWDNESFDYYITDGRRVINVFGSKCACGCDIGGTAVKVIGKIKHSTLLIKQ